MKVLKYSDFEVDNIDMNDAYDFVDAYISSATAHLEDGTTRPATDDELNELSEDRDLVGSLVEKEIY